MAGRRRLPAEEEEHENSERWLLTYADMITLLMVLFIVLFAIGQMDQRKFNQLQAGLAQSFGQSTVIDGGSGVLEGASVQAPAPDGSRGDQQSLDEERQAVLSVQPDLSADEATKAARAIQDAKAAAAARAAAAAEHSREQQMAGVQRSISKALSKEGLSGTVRFQAQERGLVVNVVTDRVLFDLGSAHLRGEGVRVLDAIAPVVRGVPNRLLIEGHTDDVPVTGGQFASNWELSTMRATVVLHRLIQDGVTAPRLAAAGYADQRPLVPGDSAAARARNRRVAIVVLSPSADSSSGRSRTTAATQTRQ